MKKHSFALILLLVAPLQAACVAQAERKALPSSVTPATKTEALSCPSQDFSVFLQRFADAQDDTVRSAFTADPVVYEVLFYTVAEETEDSPEMFVSQESGASRLDHFRYRYFPRAGDYDRIYSDGKPHALPASHRGANKYPVSIKELPDNGREVVFGFEYEIDIYEFKRAHGCWFLMRIVNPSD